MSIDYGAEIPEVNSGRIYAGAGSGPLMATAAAWAEQAAELMTGASGLAGILGTLSANWQGPSSEAMVASIAPYLAWMLKTAEAAAHAAATHTAAAVAHDAAFMGVVPPPVITANQTALAAAIGGLPWTAPLVAQLEAQYQEMWAQDATALYAYSASITAAIGGLEGDATTPALPTTVDGGVGAMADSAGQAAGQSAGTAAQTASGAGNQAASMGSGMSSALGSAGSAAGSAGQALSSPLNSLGQAGQSLMQPLSSIMGQFGQMANPAMSGLGSLGGLMNGFGAGGLGSSGGLGGGGGGISPMMAGMGRAGELQGSGPRLSVPQNWGSASPLSNVKVLSSTGGSMAVAPVSEDVAPVGSAGRPPMAMIPPGAGAGGGGTHAGSLAAMGVKDTGRLRGLVATNHIKPPVF